MDGEEIYKVGKVDLDSYLDEKGIAEVNLLKIDAEGSEFPILKGASRLLGDRKHRPIVLIELNPDTSRAAGYNVKQMADWLFEVHGYRFYQISRRGLLSPIAQPEALGLTDAVALCPDFHAEQLAITRS